MDVLLASGIVKGSNPKAVLISRKQGLIIYLNTKVS